MPVSGALQFVDLSAHVSIRIDVRSVIDPRGDGLDLIPQSHVIVIHESESIGLLAEPHDLLRNIHGPLAALREMPRQNRPDAGRRYEIDQLTKLRRRVLRALV